MQLFHFTVTIALDKKKKKTYDQRCFHLRLRDPRFVSDISWVAAIVARLVDGFPGTQPTARIWLLLASSCSLN